MSLESLIHLQDDQISSQFLISFPNGIPGGGNTDELGIRMDTEFDPPARVTGKYKVWSQGQSIDKTSVVEETEKAFNLNFRLDQNWNVYDSLNAWFKKTYNEELGTADNDVNTRVPMHVPMYGANKKVKRTLKYEGVKITSIKLSSLGNENGDPVRVECEFIYLRYSDE